MFQMNLIKNLKTSYEIVLSNDKKLLCHLMGGKKPLYLIQKLGKKLLN